MIVTMRLAGKVHCELPKALQAMHLFALLYGESRVAALSRPGIEFVCEPLPEERRDGTKPHEAFFVRWVCSPSFQFPMLCGVVTANPDGLTTTVTFDAVYEPDGGFIGAFYDRCVGRRFAKAAARTFFHRVLRFVEQDAGLDNLLDRLLYGGRTTGRT